MSMSNSSACKCLCDIYITDISADSINVRQWQYNAQLLLSIEAHGDGPKEKESFQFNNKRIDVTQRSDSDKEC